MATIIPFKAFRPVPEKAADLAALPYDVFKRHEARKEVELNPESFLAIDRPETAFPEDYDMYSPEVYRKADDLLQKKISDGVYIQEEKPCYYLYEQTYEGRTQRGIVGCVAVSDYEDGVVLKHEKTRAEKEEDRINHIDVTSAQTGPIFLAHRHNYTIERIIEDTVNKCDPVYDFTKGGGVRHRVFVIDDAKDIDNIRFAFGNIPKVYIADGHHRAASAVEVSKRRREANPRHTGKEEYNYFLSVLFAEDQLKIMEYNRLVKDYNWLTPTKLLKKLDTVADRLEDAYYALRPTHKGQFGVFLDDHWYLYQFHQEDMVDDPVEGLDASILQKVVLEPVFGIKDPKKDRRLDFIGGIRGPEGIEQRCETDMKVGFLMYPLKSEELLAVADEGRLMPPKSTWFEPKLLSGLFIHLIERF